MRIILLLLMCFSIISVTAQTLNDYSSQINALYSKGEYPAAVSLAEKALSQPNVINEANTGDYAYFLNGLGILYSTVGSTQKAEEKYIQAKDLYARLLGTSSRNYLSTAGNLAGLYYDMGKFDKAIVLNNSIKTEYEKKGELQSSYAMVLNNLGLAYNAISDNKNAELLFTQAIKIYKSLPGFTKDQNYATTLSNLAYITIDKGDLKKAEQLYLEAKAIYGNTVGKSDPSYGNCLNSLGSLYKQMGNYSQAEQLYIEAGNIIKQKLGENHPQYTACLGNLAQLYSDMGSYTKAEALFMQVIRSDKATMGETHPSYLTDVNNLAMVYKKMEQYKKAESLQAYVVQQIKKNHGEKQLSYALALNGLGAIYADEGQYEKAEQLYNDSKEIIKAIYGDTNQYYATALNNLAAIYNYYKDYKKSQELLVSALAIDKKIYGNQTPEYAQCLDNLATAYYYTNDFDKIAPLVKEAAEIRKKVFGENGPEYAQSVVSGAYLYFTAGQFEKAEPLYLKACEIFKKNYGENNLTYIDCVSKLAALYLFSGNYSKAELLYTKVKDIRFKVLGPDSDDYATTLNNLATVYSNTGRYDNAAAYSNLANTIFLNNMIKAFSVLSEKQKTNFTDKAFYNFEFANSIIYNKKINISAGAKNNFNQLLVLKSVSLVDTKNMLEAIRNNKDTSVKKLFTEWEAMKSFLAKQYSLPVDKRAGDLKNIESAAEDKEKMLNRMSSEFRTQQQALRISMTDIQKGLQPDEAAVEYVRFRYYDHHWTDSVFYAAYLLRKSDTAPQFIPLCEEKNLQRLFDRAGKNTTDQVSSLYGDAIVNNANGKTPGDSLYKYIWQPLEPYLNGITKVSFSPAGKLFTVAFNALPASDGKFLIDKYELKEYTSTRQIALRSSALPVKIPNSIALFGNATFTMDSAMIVNVYGKQKAFLSDNIKLPKNRGGKNSTWLSLPGTATEIKDIQELFLHNKINTSLFEGVQCSEENLKALNGRAPRILHIATHGFFLPNEDTDKKETNLEQGPSQAGDPLMRSGVVMAGANYVWGGKLPINGVEDGICTAYEISQLNLSNSDLVVLSACETGLGDIQGSEGVFGLQRAFKVAGVKKIIVSLWQVPDKETSELMALFYSNYLSGKDIAKSFYLAQEEMRKKYSPYSWASFVLTE